MRACQSPWHAAFRVLKWPHVFGHTASLQSYASTLTCVPFTFRLVQPEALRTAVPTGSADLVPWTAVLSEGPCTRS